MSLTIKSHIFTGFQTKSLLPKYKTTSEPAASYDSLHSLKHSNSLQPPSVLSLYFLFIIESSCCLLTSSTFPFPSLSLSFISVPWLLSNQCLNTLDWKFTFISFVNFMNLQYEESEKVPWPAHFFITGSEFKRKRAVFQKLHRRHQFVGHVENKWP